MEFIEPKSRIYIKHSNVVFNIIAIYFVVSIYQKKIKKEL